MKTHDLAQVFRLRGELVELLGAEYGGQAVRGPEFARFVTIVAEALPITDLDQEVLYDSLRHLAGVPLTDEVLQAACHRLAGNLARFANRRAVIPWHGQRLPEWVPVQIMGSRPEKKGRKFGAVFTFKILAGTPCPLIVFQFWSLKRCRFHATDAGFSKPAGANSRHSAKYPFTDCAQFVTLRFSGLVSPELSGREPVISEIKFPGALLRWNRDRLKSRFRVDPGFDCPKGFPLTLECHRCRFGYESCPAGTHRRDYEKRPCSVCGLDDALWDPESPANRCVDCQGRESRKEKINE